MSKVCKSVHHRTIKINHQPDSTIFKFIILAFIYSSTGFGHCVRGRAGLPARPRTQHDCHHDTKVKPEAATAFIELLMMGGKTPETCWAVNKRQDNKLRNCYIWLVIYLNRITCYVIIGIVGSYWTEGCQLFVCGGSPNCNKVQYSCQAWL
jgi:hypothetical protein